MANRKQQRPIIVCAAATAIAVAADFLPIHRHEHFLPVLYVAIGLIGCALLVAISLALSALIARKEDFYDR